MNRSVDFFRFSNGTILELVSGDLTTETVDAIVNAANSRLQHGGGVALAILNKGGDILREDSLRWVRENGPVSHDRPAYTRAGKLPCHYVIHAVGPIWGQGDEETKLASAVRASLELAETLGLHSIAFPAISTGIFGFPRQLAARTMLAAIQEYIAVHPSSTLDIIHIVLWDEPSLADFQQEFIFWKTSLESLKQK